MTTLGQCGYADILMEKLVATSGIEIPNGVISTCTVCALRWGETVQRAISIPYLSSAPEARPTVRY